MSNELEQPIWRPSDTDVFKANMTSFMNYLFSQNIKTCTNYEELYEWSLNHSGMFWKSFWDFCDIIHSEAPTSILEGDDIRKAVWFRNAKLNFAENLLRKNSNDIAIKYRSETKPTDYIRYSELNEKVAALASALKKAGVDKGDRVAALITNRPEAIIGMLAASSIGAVWSSCSPDFGYQGVLDRFGQIKPKILLTIDAYSYNGKVFDMIYTASKLADSIPEIEEIIVIDSDLQEYDLEIEKAVYYDDFVSDEYEELTFEQLPFDHPLYIMYS
ncbi:MAG: acetoacetate--CoA ligase, partial [Calditrichaeota bacterium]